MLQEIGSRAKNQVRKKRWKMGRSGVIHRAKTNSCDMKELTFYTKPDCPLCEESYPKVERLAQRYGLGIKRVNIETDRRLFKRHKHRIPVVELAGRELAWGRISEKGLDRILQRMTHDEIPNDE